VITAKYKTVREATIEFVRLGYGDCFGLPVRSLDFRTEGMEADLAQEVVALVEGYNEYKAATVAKAVGLIAQVWASECQQVTFAFGRERSPVLYVRAPWWLTEDKRMEETERLTKISETREILRAAKADELDDIGESTIRAWWD
jgi:hypothetical protein